MACTKLNDHSDPIVIEDNAYYTPEAAQVALGLRRTCIRRELRERRLRYCKRGGRILIPGPFLREWIDGGESVRRPKPSPT